MGEKNLILVRGWRARGLNWVREEGCEPDQGLKKEGQELGIDLSQREEVQGSDPGLRTEGHTCQ